jgi:hypothetical protein
MTWGEPILGKLGSVGRKRLAAKVRCVHLKYMQEIRELPRRSAEGYLNGYYIPGWTKSPNDIVSDACTEVGMPTLPWWGGVGDRLTAAVPECCIKELENAYDDVYGKE